MNLAQMKIALEESVTAEIKNNLKGDVEVNTSYDIQNGVIVSEMITVTPRTEEGNSSSILCYNVEYGESDNDVKITAFNRVYLYDALGIAVVNNETVPVSRSFLEAMRTIIALGMDKVYNPEKYSDEKVAE
jgi:hypothetical protein